MIAVLKPFGAFAIPEIYRNPPVCCVMIPCRPKPEAAFLPKRDCRRTASTDTARQQLNHQIKELPLSVGKLRRIHRIPCKGIRTGIRQGEIHFCCLGGAKILVGTGILHLVKGIPEHLIVGFLPV